MQGIALKALTSIGFQGRADHGHHGGLAVPTNAVLEYPCQLAVPTPQCRAVKPQLLAKQLHAFASSLVT